MSNNESGGDSSDGAECPTCNGSFVSEHGVKVHHKSAHGESLKTRVVVTCAWCGDEKETYPYLAEKNDRHFCSNGCKGNWRSENWVGENAPAWSGGKVTIECDECGSEREVYPAVAASRTHHFCPGRECYGKWLSATNGSDHHLWNRTTVECEWCGKGKDVKRVHYEAQELHFCTDSDCRANWLAEQWAGDQNPNWMGGTAEYGPGWNDAKKELVRERDGRVCQNPGCGRGEKEHVEQFGKKHSVHHIQKARTFDNPEKRNHPDNLITLCETRECHYRWEQMSPLRPQIAGDD